MVAHDYARKEKRKRIDKTYKYIHLIRPLKLSSWERWRGSERKCTLHINMSEWTNFQICSFDFFWQNEKKTEYGGETEKSIIMKNETNSFADFFLQFFCDYFVGRIVVYWRSCFCNFDMNNRNVVFFLWSRVFVKWIQFQLSSLALPKKKKKKMAIHHHGCNPSQRRSIKENVKNMFFQNGEEIWCVVWPNTAAPTTTCSEL